MNDRIDDHEIKICCATFYHSDEDFHRFVTQSFGRA